MLQKRASGALQALAKVSPTCSQKESTPEAGRPATAPSLGRHNRCHPITFAGFGKSSHLNAALDEIAEVLRGRR